MVEVGHRWCSTTRKPFWLTHGWATGSWAVEVHTSSCGSTGRASHPHRTDATAGASTKQPNTNIQSLPQLNVLGHPQHSLQLQKTIKQQWQSESWYIFSYSNDACSMRAQWENLCSMALNWNPLIQVWWQSIHGKYSNILTIWLKQSMHNCTLKRAMQIFHGSQILRLFWPQFIDDKSFHRHGSPLQC